MKSELRRKLAVDVDAEITSPLTIGTFVRIAAETAEEDRVDGRKRATLYWRVITDDGSLSPKFLGGSERQTRQLRTEGLTFVGKGKKPPSVKQFERSLCTFK